jgi:lipoprotein NlpI
MDVRRQIVMALAACPASPEVLVRKGYDLLTSNRAKKIEEAEAVLEFARKVDQTYTDTLLATAGLLMLQKRPEEAQPVFDLLIAQDKDAPDVLVGQALNFSLLDKTRGITDLLNRAMKLDEDRWNDVYVPKPLDYINRLMRYRITPMLGPASLYPEG